MSKYIDADRLRTEIERQIAFLPTVGYSTQVASEFIPVQNTLNYILSFIDSLQQEQPGLPDMEGARDYYYHRGLYAGMAQGRADALKILEEFAKSKADPVIVIRQEEQPKMNIPSAGSGAMGTTPPKFKLDVKRDLPVSLEKEIQEYLEKLGGGHGGFVDDLTDDDLTGFARHFYELGLKAKKK